MAMAMVRPWLAAPTRSAVGSLWARASGSEPALKFISIAQRRPFLVSGITSGASMWLTDIGMQRLTADEQDGWDWRRSLSMLTWGLVWYGGPQQFYWTRLYPALIGQGTTKQAALKVFADVIVNPLCTYVPCFYMLTGLVKGYSLNQSWENLKNEYVEACFGMAAFWLPVQFGNFRFVHVHFQTYVVSVANIVNKSWLSWLSNRSRVDERHTAAAAASATSSTAAHAATPHLPLEELLVDPPLVGVATAAAMAAATGPAALLASAALPQAAA